MKDRFSDLILTALMLLLANILVSQSKPAYVIVNNKGKQVSYSKMLKKLSKSDVVLFGEIHNNPICHWLQLEVSMDLFAIKPISLGAEMFERDYEESLQLYLQGAIDEGEFKDTVKLWKNFRTDYQPLVEFAKKHSIPFVGTNIPRRFASMVYRDGFEVLDSLSDQEKSWIAPLPILYDPEVPCYKNMLDMVPGHGGPNFPKAQAIKDATMAHFILHHLRSDRLFLHIHGTYHSDNYEGILWYLRKFQPNLTYSTISSVSQEDLSKLESEHMGKADFILVVPDRMTNTY